MGADVVVRARRAVVGEHEVAATVHVEGGRITAVEAFDADVGGAPVVDLADDEVLLPALVDTHVHVNEPGRTEWEGFASATRAAAAGGVGTVVDMPLNSLPPTVTAEALAAKRAVASGQCLVDVAFWGGAVPGNLADLAPLHEAGVLGFKAFLVDSGVPEFGHLDDAGLRAALAEVARLGSLLLLHAEDPAALEAAPPASGRGYRRFLASRPREAEERAVERVVTALRETGGRAHVVHLSDADAVPIVAAAQAEGLALTAETCPHYLALTAEDVPDGATEFKCCPPIRERGDQDGLWAGLAAGTIGAVVSDHSPSTVDLKRLDSGDFGEAWGGIAGLQLALPVVWTEARRRGHTLVDVVRWMARGPADLVGLTDRGRIEPGAVAHLAVLAPDTAFTVDVAALHHRNPVSPYAGRVLTGVVRQTWLHGAPVDLAAAPRGRLLTGGTP
ncbi:MAG TPA: allantoinase AllB [Pedococcus sp.]|uniref:allantoinase AllB n=1 Tax=Pedococcus sp. TaxID=2860345 RepID=UPI002F943434